MTAIDLNAPMHCRSCEERVRRNVSRLAGTLRVTTDLKRQSVPIDLDEDRVAETDVRETVRAAVDHGSSKG